MQQQEYLGPHSLGDPCILSNMKQVKCCVIIISAEGHSCRRSEDCGNSIFRVCDYSRCRRRAPFVEDSTSLEKFCSSNRRTCKEREGHCEKDDDCNRGLKCGVRNCPDSFPYPYANCCYKPPPPPSKKCY